MIKNISRFLMIIAFVLSSFMCALAEMPPVEIFGFADAYHVSSQASSTESKFRFGQVEIDLRSNVEENITVSCAVAYNQGAEVFGLGPFTIDFHLFGSDGNHYKSVSGISKSGIIVGKINVPFGIDHRVLPAPARLIASRPIAVNYTHNSWGDYGTQFYISNDMFNGVLFLTNGFGYSVTTDDVTGGVLGYNQFTQASINATTSTDIGTSSAFGGRVGATPVEMIEVGASYAGFMNADDEMDMGLFGVDFQFKKSRFALKGEYIMHILGSAGDNSVTNNGMYVQGAYDLGRYFTAVKFGTFTPDYDDADTINRITVGVGNRIGDNAQIRIEYQMNDVTDVEDDDQVFLQFVVAF